MIERSLSREDVIKAFGVKEFQKGLQYFKEGRIVSAMETEGRIIGIVQGSMDRPHEVMMDLDDLQGSVLLLSGPEHVRALRGISYSDRHRCMIW